MGKRGPSPKPTKLKILSGNPGKRPLNQNEPKPKVEKEIPDPPPWLSTHAKKEWKRVTPELHRLGLLTMIDIAVLASYCQSYDRLIRAEKKIRAYEKEHGCLTAETPSGYSQQIPEIGIANQAMKNIKSFAQEFGMTPSSRSKIDVESPDDGVDPFISFMRGGSRG